MSESMPDPSPVALDAPAAPIATPLETTMAQLDAAKACIVRMRHGWWRRHDQSRGWVWRRSQRLGPDLIDVMTPAEVSVMRETDEMPLPPRSGFHTYQGD